MAETRTITLYKFEELSSKAKEKAREWYREGLDFDPEFEPYTTAAKLLGIGFSQRAIPTHSGGARYESDIKYSGFYSQGDGASFTGAYEYAKGSLTAITKEFPTETTLHRIARDLVDLQRKHGYRLTANITQEGRYVHARTMGCEITAPAWLVDGSAEAYNAAQEPLLRLFRDFADWIYKGLEEEYEYQRSDEAVDDNMIANDYTFTVSGDRSDDGVPVDEAISAAITLAYDALKDIANADSNGHPYTGKELQDIALPAIDSLLSHLPSTHADHQAD